MWCGLYSTVILGTLDIYWVQYNIYYSPNAWVKPWQWCCVISGNSPTGKHCTCIAARIAFRSIAFEQEFYLPMEWAIYRALKDMKWKYLQSGTFRSDLFSWSQFTRDPKYKLLSWSICVSTHRSLIKILDTWAFLWDTKFPLCSITSHDFRMRKKFYRNILSLPPKKIYIYVQ